MSPRFSRRKFLVGAALGPPAVAGGSLALRQVLADPRELSRDLKEAVPWVPKPPRNRMVVEGRPSFWAGVNYP